MFLNIYTPLIKGKKLPVLCWIHGGAMVAGSGSPYNGHAFADKDIPVYLYRFNYAKGIAEAGHGTELPFVWYQPLNSRQPVGEQLLEIARRLFKGADPLALQMHHAWVQSIKKGDPNIVQAGTWAPYTDKNKTDQFFNTPRSFPVKPDSVFNDKNFPAAVSF